LPVVDCRGKNESRSLDSGVQKQAAFARDDSVAGGESAAKSQRLKNLRINLWDSIICREKFRNLMILKNEGRGGG